jgi:hypothetical protein
VSEKDKLYRVELEPLGVYFAFTVFQKWRHHVDAVPFNFLFIKGLSYLINIGSFQPRSTLYVHVIFSKYSRSSGWSGQGVPGEFHNSGSVLGDTQPNMTNDGRGNDEQNSHQDRVIFVSSPAYHTPGDMSALLVGRLAALYLEGTTQVHMLSFCCICLCWDALS